MTTTTEAEWCFCRGCNGIAYHPRGHHYRPRRPPTVTTLATLADALALLLTTPPSDSVTDVNGFPPHHQLIPTDPTICLSTVNQRGEKLAVGWDAYTSVGSC